MPELPEVETIRRQLAAAITGLHIIGIELRRADIVSGDHKTIIGKKINGVRRFSKLLVIDLEGDASVAIHLKMTGQLIVVNSKSQNPNTKNKWEKDYFRDKHTHVIISFQSGEKLLFNDQRRFGYIQIVPTLQVSDLKYIKNLGKEFLSNLTIWQFSSLISSSRRPIKQLLLDQTKFAGVGNIYACEALWRAGIDPRTECQSIKESKASALFTAIEAVLKEAITRHGASRQNFRDIYGQKGEVQNHFNVYERKGEPCPKCGTAIAKFTLGGRGTYACPKCQVT